MTVGELYDKFENLRKTELLLAHYKRNSEDPRLSYDYKKEMTETQELINILRQEEVK